MSTRSSFTIALAQINPTVGHIAGNTAKIVEYYEKAKAQGADLVICPELCVTGYPPEDLVLMPSFQKDAMRAVLELAKHTAGGPALVVGSVWTEKGNITNAALWLDGGKVAHVQAKTQLPNYGVFDEKRLFTAAETNTPLDWRGITIGLLICEDVWTPELPASLAAQGAQLLIVINASPFEAGKLAQRHAVAAKIKLPLIYVNTVGGQDDLVFDGGSFITSANGKVIHQVEEFTEALSICVIPAQAGIPLDARANGDIDSRLRGNDDQRLWQAMCLGLSDYVRKNGFGGVVLGLSGGIDSALTAAIAVDALGAERVKGVLLPSPYTSTDSVEDALTSAKLLGIETMTIPITPGMTIMEEVLSPVFRESQWMNNVSIGGNVQARLRGLTLMALSNRFDWMLLSTGNKSEIAVGYSTLYGDSCGGYNVLKDLYKTQVYQLAHWRNAEREVIPARSITKAPSAELAPGQTDQDQLPPYDILDQILAHHLEGRLGAEDIIALGFAPEIVHKILKMVRVNEYKRRQSCPGVKLSSMLFGKDRRFPLTNKA